jgi:hypothetical protein
MNGYWPSLKGRKTGRAKGSKNTHKYSVNGGYYLGKEQFYCQGCGRVTPATMGTTIGSFKVCRGCAESEDSVEFLTSRGVEKWERKDAFK